MKKLGLTLMLAALVALAAVATASARSGAATGSARTSSVAVADDHGSGSGHDSSDDRSDDHGHHGEGADDNGGQRAGDDGVREPGEDVRGNCDEAEHASDAACLAAAAAPATTAPSSGSERRAHEGARHAGAERLVATVGSGFTITLRTTAGAAVKTLAAGTYTVVVRDRSDEHNFHLSGRGLDKTTSVDAVSTSTWRVRLKAGTYTFKCDPHAQVMRGSIRVV